MKTPCFYSKKDNALSLSRQQVKTNVIKKAPWTWNVPGGFLKLIT